MYEKLYKSNALVPPQKNWIRKFIKDLKTYLVFLMRKIFMLIHFKKLNVIDFFQKNIAVKQIKEKQKTLIIL